MKVERKQKNFLWLAFLSLCLVQEVRIDENDIDGIKRRETSCFIPDVNAHTDVHVHTDVHTNDMDEEKRCEAHGGNNQNSKSQERFQNIRE